MRIGLAVDGIGRRGAGGVAICTMNYRQRKLSKVCRVCNVFQSVQGLQGLQRVQSLSGVSDIEYVHGLQGVSLACITETPLAQSVN